MLGIHTLGSTALNCSWVTMFASPLDNQLAEKRSHSGGQADLAFLRWFNPNLVQRAGKIDSIPLPQLFRLTLTQSNPPMLDAWEKETCLVAVTDHVVNG